MKKVAVLAGDGIGPEVVEVALKVLKKALGDLSKEFIWTTGLVGGAAIDSVGHPLPKETLRLCEDSDAIFFGSVGGPKWENLPPDLQPERGALLPLRKHFQLFANLRPVKLYPALKKVIPIKEERIQNGVDLLVVRELTGDVYFGQPKGREGFGETEKAYDTMIYHRYEIERITKVALDSAKLRRKKITSIDKANVLTTMVFWREVVTNYVHRYNQENNEKIELEHMYVDNAAMQLILNPSRFDVILCSNMFGDILSDEASVLGGSLGMLSSASLSVIQNSQGYPFGLYEPAGGSAPDIAGKGVANPIAQILSGALMLRYSFGLDSIAKKIEDAVERALQDGARTKDLAFQNENYLSTIEMGEKILSYL
ncbi:MAG: 3-isopropylmalate dehydrogenase [Leptospiraceae bacterium]|nr:3-isopropylmalate dehydrogenase [Leptospiraceae bacterium]MDW7976481.1 3-isopropylmalate dehydrogenase [Leptospiraceae bacterium]